MKKTITAILLAVMIMATLSLAISYVNAKHWSNSGITSKLGNAFGHSNRPNQQNLVKISGLITQWGTTNVNGSFSTQAKTTIFNASESRQIASASAIWTTNGLRPIKSIRAAENFTYSFYSAKLANASISKLNLDESDYFINGTWNVYNVTSVVTITTNSEGEIINVHRDSDTAVSKAYGELNVTSNWTTFKLSIDGMEPLTGSVVRSRTSLMQFNQFKFADDDTTSNAVTRTDVTTIGRAYGSMPGWGNYDQSMDFNGNYRIDIADIVTVAANVQ